MADITHARFESRAEGRVRWPVFGRVKNEDQNVALNAPQEVLNLKLRWESGCHEWCRSKQYLLTLQVSRYGFLVLSEYTSVTKCVTKNNLSKYVKNKEGIRHFFVSSWTTCNSFGLLYEGTQVHIKKLEKEFPNCLSAYRHNISALVFLMGQNHKCPEYN